MSKIDRFYYHLIAGSPSYKKAHVALIMRLEEALDDTCYVSFSAGKDSSVVAHAAHRVRPGIPILMVDPGCPTHWMESERTRWMEYAYSNGWNLRLFPWDKWGCVDGESDVKKATDKIHRNMFAELDEYAQQCRLTTRIMGLRSEESRGRRISTRHLGMDAELKDGTRRIIPISWWPSKFVWAYIVSNNLPWLDIYDYCGPDTRNGLIGVNGIERGRLHYLKRYFPEAWAMAKKVLPEIETTAI